MIHNLIGIGGGLILTGVIWTLRQERNQARIALESWNEALNTWHEAADDWAHIANLACIERDALRSERDALHAQLAQWQPKRDDKGRFVK